MSKFKHSDIFAREVVFEDEEEDFGKVMRESSKSLRVIGGEKRKSNLPEENRWARTYEYRQSLPNPR